MRFFKDLVNPIQVVSECLNYVLKQPATDVSKNLPCISKQSIVKPSENLPNTSKQSDVKPFKKQETEDMIKISPSKLAIYYLTTYRLNVL